MANLELYQQKLQAERLAAMGQTVASLSHSIKNILQGLRGGADVVEVGLKREDFKVARGGWTILKRNLDRIIGLTTNMLAYSRPITIEPELCKLSSLLDECAQLMADQCKAREVALIVDADADMPPVPLDTGQIHQCVMNLLTNAVEAVEAKTGVVTVRASFTPEPGGIGRGVARIEVIDNGPGIPPAIIDKVFTPFFTTKGIRGTGLGLAVTRRIIEQHRGSVEVKSNLGKGASFALVIPVDPTQRFDPAETTQQRGEVRRA
jgi:signal transduction histidine kinase